MKDGDMMSDELSFKSNHYIIHKNISEHSQNFFKHLSDKDKLFFKISIYIYSNGRGNAL